MNVKILSTVEEYDPTTDTWTKKANMPTAKYALGASVVNGKIYAIGGGHGQGVFSSTVEQYDPTTNTWTRKANMPTKRIGLSTSAVSGKIYAIGGWRPRGDIGRALSTVEVYDPAQDKCAKKANMPTARALLVTSVVNGRIYAIGGITTPIPRWEMVSTVEVYNPVSGRWTKGPDMLKQRGWHAASAVLGKIYVIGGASRCLPEDWPTSVLSTVEELDTGYALNAQGKLPTLWGEIKRSK